jgi:Cu/Ag efflux protein CusF
MLIVTPAFAQGTKAQCQPSGKAPQKIEGQVTKVDKKSGTVTVKRSDGSTHEFKGDPETVRDYKKGDQIELTLRSEPC